MEGAATLVLVLVQDWETGSSGGSAVLVVCLGEEDNKLRERSRGGWVAGITGTVVSWGAAIAFMRLCGFRGRGPNY